MEALQSIRDGLLQFEVHLVMSEIEREIKCVEASMGDWELVSGEIGDSFDVELKEYESSVGHAGKACGEL